MKFVHKNVLHVTKLILLFSILVKINCESCENLWSGKNKKFPDSLISRILTTHNQYRSQIAEGSLSNEFGNFPKASNMNQLYWSEKLSRKAQLWANDCKNEHSGEQFRSIAGDFVGENIFLKANPGSVRPELMDWEGIIKKWFKENVDFDVNKIYPYETVKGTENFSQLVWATSIYIGCGYSAFKTKEGNTNQLYVCHYSPGGNKILKELYNSGKICGRCQEGFVCKSEYKGLCCKEKYCSKGSLEIKSKLK